jgi:hypothetical protein
MKPVKIRFNTTAYANGSVPVELARGTELTLVAQSKEESLVRDSEGRALTVHNEFLMDSGRRLVLEKTEQLVVDWDRTVALDSDRTKSTALLACEEVTLFAVEGAEGICRTGDGKVVLIKLEHLHPIVAREALAV